MKGVPLSRSRTRARRLAIYELYLTGANSPDIAASNEFQQRWGPISERQIRDSITIMNRQNTKWYEDNKMPEKRIGVFFKQQVDRFLTLLKQQYILFYGYHTPQSLGWKEGMRDQSMLKLQCAGLIERTIYHLSDVLGVKARSVDDQTLEVALNKLLSDARDYKQKQEEEMRLRMKQKVHPL